MSDNKQGDAAPQESADEDNGTETEAADTATTVSGDDGPAGDESGGEAEVSADAEAKQGGIPAMTAPQSREQPSAVKATAATRKAHLTVSRVEPPSVMKLSFVISLVCFIILLVAVGVVYGILSALGVFDALTELIVSLTEGEGEELQVNPETWFSFGRVIFYTSLIGALNVVLITALATVGSMLYNLAADLVGGIDVTLREIQ